MYLVGPYMDCCIASSTIHHHLLFPRPHSLAFFCIRFHCLQSLIPLIRRPKGEFHIGVKLFQHHPLSLWIRSSSPDGEIRVLNASATGLVIETGMVPAKFYTERRAARFPESVHQGLDHLVVSGPISCEVHRAHIFAIDA